MNKTAKMYHHCKTTAVRSIKLSPAAVRTISRRVSRQQQNPPGKRQQEENKIEKFDETAFSGQTEIFSRRNAGQRERSVLVESVNKKDCRNQQRGNNAI